MPMSLTDAEAEVLIDGLSDDVAFVWVLIHLGLSGNSPSSPGPPTPDVVDAALETLDRLSQAGLVRVGHMEYLDGGPPGRVAPVKHVEDPVDEVADRVRAACSEGHDWEWACWVVNTAAGDEAARTVLATRPDAP